MIQTTMDHIELSGEHYCAFRINSTTRQPDPRGPRCGEQTNQGLKMLGVPGLPRKTPVIMPLCNRHMELAMTEGQFRALDKVNQQYGPRDAPVRHDPSSGPRRLP